MGWPTEATALSLGVRRVQQLVAEAGLRRPAKPMPRDLAADDRVEAGGRRFHRPARPAILELAQRPLVLEEGPEFRQTLHCLRLPWGSHHRRPPTRAPGKWEAAQVMDRTMAERPP